MDNSPNDQSFISGIYNYCDRWCERCQFTDRCRVFAKEQESPVDDDDMESVVRAVGASLAEAKQMLLRFPLARDFVRPGFDEIEIVM